MIKKLSPTLLLEITVIATILLSGYLLFAYEKENHNLDYNKSWTSFYFTDSYHPEEGTKVENHLGVDTSFQFCLILDNDNLTEPGDLSCDLPNILSKEEKTIKKGETESFKYVYPKEKGKYWALLIYKDKDNIEQKRSLSFEN